MRTTFALAVLALLASRRAAADPIEFDFDTPSAPSFSKSYNVAGLDLSVVGFSDASLAFVTEDLSGLGVWDGTLGDILGNLDSFGPNESMLFVFEKEVRLDSIEFNWVDSDDEFFLMVGPSVVYYGGIPGAGSSRTFDALGTIGAPSLFGTVFRVGVIDDYGINSLRIGGLNVTPNPEPGTLILGAGSLAAAWLRKRRKAKAAALAA